MERETSWVNGVHWKALEVAGWHIHKGFLEPAAEREEAEPVL